MTMEKMYSMNETLKGEGNMTTPKKENMLYSMFNALSAIWERVSRVPASFLAGTNYPLSVTVVHNDGIISHGFFENLTTKRKILNTDKVYIDNTQIKESLNIPHDILDNKKFYVNRIFNENTKENVKFNYNYIDDANKEIRSDKKKSAMKENIKDNTINCDYLSMEENKETHGHFYSNVNKCKPHTKHTHNYENSCDKATSKKNQFSNGVVDTIGNKEIVNKEPIFSTHNSNTLCIQSINHITVSGILTNMWQKVYDSVTDRFYKTDSIESDVTMKRSSLSPKQRRKLNTIAKGRGRGRAKLQLRRSGVSQTRHRKERTKHDLVAEIRNDLRNWQEFEIYHMSENEELDDCFSLDEDAMNEVHVNPIMYTFADIKPEVQKPKTCKIVNHGMSKFPTRMRYIPECMEKPKVFEYEKCFGNIYNTQRSTYRPRLVSESSIDSEDSYCIVFEASPETTYKSDLEDLEDTFEESDTDQTSEDEDIHEDEKFVSPVQKVKFNLNPVVHIMVQWDYAYRAARRGPWEEMARDRERFKGRINCIEHILNPILTSQHRTHIWQERFAHTE